MRARIERDFSSFAVRVWLLGDHANPASDNQILHRIVGPDAWETEEVRPGQAIPAPSFVLSTEALEAIVREATDVLPASDATSAHLKDAISVRDRLLKMVEESA